MKKVSRFFSALLSVLITAAFVPAEAFAEERTTPSGIPYDEISAKINEYAFSHSFPSYRVGVFCGGEVLYEGGEGYIDRENDVKTDSDSVYEWGSVTKLITWISVMQLYEQGRIDLDADVREYLPDSFVQRLRYREPITMMNLMNHTPGFEETIRDIFVTDENNLRSLPEALLYSEPNQVFHPGEITSYSNWGAALAGYVVECISGEDFAEYVHKHIFEPAGMERTSIAPDHSDNMWVKEQREKVYSYTTLEMDGETLLIPRGRQLSYVEPYPAGSAAGTIGDLVKFGQALVSDNCPFFERQETADLMFSASSFLGDTDIPKCCHGFWPGQGAVQYLGHSGATDGFSANLQFDPESKLGCAVFVNQYAETSINEGIPLLLFGSPDNSGFSGVSGPDLSGTYIMSRGHIENSLKVLSYFSVINIKKNGENEFSAGEATLRNVGSRLVLLESGEISMLTEVSEDGKRLYVGSAELIKSDSAMLMHILVFVYIGVAAAGFITVIAIWIMKILKQRRKLAGALPICASHIAKVVSCLCVLTVILAFGSTGVPVQAGIVSAVIQIICLILYALSAVSDVLLLARKTGGRGSAAVYSVDAAANVLAIAVAVVFNVCGG